MPAFSHAEYRVFVLKISKRAPAGTAAPASAEGGQGFRLVESTLDPEQYKGFYPIAPDEDITYIDTWRCYGRTGDFAPLCPNPKGQNPAEQKPAS
jgi:hypothetical protein